MRCAGPPQEQGAEKGKEQSTVEFVNESSTCLPEQDNAQKHKARLGCATNQKGGARTKGEYWDSSMTGLLFGGRSACFQSLPTLRQRASHCKGSSSTLPPQARELAGADSKSHYGALQLV